MARRVIAALALTMLMAGCGATPGAKDDARRKRRRRRPRWRRPARHLEGRRCHADRLGPEGPRRPEEADRGAQQGVHGEVPERQDRAHREVLRDLIKTVKLAASGPKAPDVVQANQGRPIMGEMVKAGLLSPVTDYAKTYGWDARYSPMLLDLNKFSSDGKEFGSGDLYGLSQMGEIVGVFYNKTMVADAADDARRVRGVAAGGQGPGQDPDPVRQPREVAWDPQLRERARADRRQAGDPRLRVRQGRGVVRQPAVHRAAPRRSRSGSTRATSTRTSTAPTTTRRGRRSPRARART